MRLLLVALFSVALIACEESDVIAGEDGFPEIAPDVEDVGFCQDIDRPYLTCVPCYDRSSPTMSVGSYMIRWIKFENNRGNEYTLYWYYDSQRCSYHLPYMTAWPIYF